MDLVSFLTMPQTNWTFLQHRLVTSHVSTNSQHMMGEPWYLNEGNGPSDELSSSQMGTLAHVIIRSLYVVLSQSL